MSRRAAIRGGGADGAAGQELLRVAVTAEQASQILTGLALLERSYQARIRAAKRAKQEGRRESLKAALALLVGCGGEHGTVNLFMRRAPVLAMLRPSAAPGAQLYLATVSPAQAALVHEGLQRLDQKLRARLRRAQRREDAAEEATVRRHLRLLRGADGEPGVKNLLAAQPYLFAPLPEEARGEIPPGLARAAFTLDALLEGRTLEPGAAPADPEPSMEHDAVRDAALRAALTDVQGAKARWETRRAAGLDEEGLEAALVEEFGEPLRGAAAPQPGYVVGVRRGRGPVFYLGGESTRGRIPTLMGERLLARVRALMEIPHPSTAASPPTDADGGHAEPPSEREAQIDELLFRALAGDAAHHGTPFLALQASGATDGELMVAVASAFAQIAGSEGDHPSIGSYTVGLDASLAAELRPAAGGRSERISGPALLARARRVLGIPTRAKATTAAVSALASWAVGRLKRPALLLRAEVRTALAARPDWPTYRGVARRFEFTATKAHHSALLAALDASSGSRTVQETVSAWLQAHVEGVGRRYAQQLHGVFANVEAVLEASEERLADALVKAGLFSRPDTARARARTLHAEIRAAAERQGIGGAPAPAGA